MRIIGTLIMMVALPMFVACGGVEGKGSTGSLSQGISSDSNHACDGLQRAHDNCPNEHACAVLQQQLIDHGCVSQCPCTAAPFGAGGPPVAFTKCPTQSIGSLVLCGLNNGVLCNSSFGPQDPAICAACRQQYNVTCQ